VSTLNLYYIITALIVAIILGGGAMLWYIVGDIRDRRKHYRVTVTTKPDGTLDVYKSKLCAMGKEPITIPARNDTPLLNIDVRLLDGEVTVSDLRNAKGLDWI
jgi:hypothetical protein